MLTKNLLRVRTYKGKVSPLFLNPTDENILMFAQSLIEVFQMGQGKTQQEIEATSEEMIQAWGGEALIGKGLFKLLCDKSDFGAANQEDISKFRQRVFEFSSVIIAKNMASWEEYRTLIAQEIGEDALAIENKLYSDLPMYNTLSSFKVTNAVHLIHLYNCSLVQCLLFSCESLTVQVPVGSAPFMRQLSKYLRFFQLVARIEREKEAFKISIDGPLSLFYQTQKYGLNLAQFFPAILLQPQWELRAVIRLKAGSEQTLALTEKCGILSHYQSFSSYAPEEIDLFMKSFMKQAGTWEILPGDDFLVLEGGSLCFPDFVFVHPNGKRICLEIFHPWHARPFALRLKTLEASDRNLLLVLALSRKLLKDPEIAAVVENSQYFSKRGILFREMPLASDVKEVLDGMLKD